MLHLPHLCIFSYLHSLCATITQALLLQTAVTCRQHFGCDYLQRFLPSESCQIGPVDHNYIILT